jgi:hypothetical protein
VSDFLKDLMLKESESLRILMKDLDQVSEEIIPLINSKKNIDSIEL